ncbi:MAG: LysM peptidoglycan-binding domain-containing protein [Clostridia bacterium]|nr:LysM peptidoglycan-binding domain-containing protein [Clostridia bacterium]
MPIHVVQRGENLTAIARRYGVSVRRVMSDNGLTAQQTLVEGQALLILVPSLVHTVIRGETLSSIAAQYGTNVITLIQYNPELSDSTALRPGQVLSIRFEEPIRGPISVSGYAYPQINDAVLRRAAACLTYLHIFSYGFTDEGALVTVDDARLIATAQEFLALPVMVFSSIGPDGFTANDRTVRLFTDSAFQNLVLDQAIAAALERGYAGIDMDFEYIPPEQTDAYLAFLVNAAEKLHQQGLFLHTDLAPKTYSAQPGLLYEAHDYPSIGEVSDRVLIMTYEWGYTYGPPLAVAPIDQVRRVVSYAVSEIDPQKILMGVPNYGYDWALPYERGISRAQSLGNEEAVRIASRRRSEILFDEQAQSPYFYYSDRGTAHVVWFEDVRSISAKLDLAEEFGVLGVGYWNVMRPFAQNWGLLSSRYTIRKLGGRSV